MSILVDYHIECMDCADMAIQEGDETTWARLRAQGNLRLVTMNDDELIELAEKIPAPKKRIFTIVNEADHTAAKWIPDLTAGKSAFQISNN